ncbi:MAG: type VI secretion system Vgr family protein [Gemmataceae bacterium]
MDQPFGVRPLAFRAHTFDLDLFLERCSCVEGISQLFRFELDLLAFGNAEPAAIARILGQACTVSLRQEDRVREFHGIISKLTRGPHVHGANPHVRYRAEMVPRAWLLSKRVRSRTFQDHTVPQILEEVLHSLPGLQVRLLLNDSPAGTLTRPFCVQYRESDFAFVSRLMEEEGLCYHFRHEEGHDVLVVSDVPVVPAELPPVNFVDGEHESGQGRVFRWLVSQNVCTDKHSVGDRHFQVFGQRLEAEALVPEQVSSGQTTYRFRHAPDAGLAVHDDVSSFAHRFDHITTNGSDAASHDSNESSAAEFNRLFNEPGRQAHLRAQREAVHSLTIDGASDCGLLTSGYRFRLDRHPDAAGEYLLTRVEHEAVQASPDSGTSASFQYQNRFQAVPYDAQLPYRPLLATARPVIVGPQTAVVVGFSDEPVTVDKYGRIKLKFQWDRQEASDTRCSCWVRVGQVWAGKRWGAFFWPRVGHEVIVEFQDGDPDRPLVVGSVYNSNNLPPFALPAGALFNGIKSCAEPAGNPAVDFNGLVFHDVKGHEEAVLHSAGHLYLSSDHDTYQLAGGHLHTSEAKARIEYHGGLPGATALPVQGAKDETEEHQQDDREGDVQEDEAGKEEEAEEHEDEFELTYNSAANWNWGNEARGIEVSLGPTVAFETTFGVEGVAFLGWGVSFAVGSEWRMAVNPVGLLNELNIPCGVAVAPPIALVGGELSFTVGAATEFVWGPTYEFIHGREVKFASGTEAAKKYPLNHLASVLAGVQGLLSMGTILASSATAPERVEPWTIEVAGGLGALNLLAGGLLLVTEIQGYHYLKGLKEADKTAYAAQEVRAALVDPTLRKLVKANLKQVWKNLKDAVAGTTSALTLPAVSSSSDKEKPDDETLIDGVWSVRCGGAELYSYSEEPLIVIKSLTAPSEEAAEGIAASGAGGILLSTDGGIGLLGGSQGVTIANTEPAAPITVGSELMTTGLLTLKQGFKQVRLELDKILVDAGLVGTVKVEGRQIVIESPYSVALQVGGSKIELSQTGIAIEGLIVTINGRAVKLKADTATASVLGG